MEKKKGPQNIDLFNWGTERISVENLTGELAMTQIHFKADGRKDNTPSLGFVLSAHEINIIGQISLATLNKCFNEFGYQITPIQENT